MRHMTHYHKSIKLRIVEYLNDHQDDLDKYANQFRALGNYKGDILDAQQKLNDVNAPFRHLTKSKTHLST